MNYNERGVLRQQHHIKSGSRKIAFKGAVTTFRFTIIAIVCAIVILCFAVAGAIKGLVSNAPSLVNLNMRPTAFKTTVYYADGTVADTLYGSEANREYANIDEIPEIVRYAFIAKEDTRFFEHKGVDVQGILRAIISDINTKSLDYGGSTITQQLLKNQIFGGGDEPNMLDKISRKVQEQYLAVQAENIYSKDEILEFYLNLINLGNGCYGIKEAAQGYFGKDVSELTLSEACVLSPIAYSPTNRNPVRYREDNEKKRAELLEAMYNQGYCTKEEYLEALEDDVYDRIMEHQKETVAVTSSPYTYFTDELIEQVMSDLQTKCGYTEREASNMIYLGGLSIYTTQDKRIQEVLDSVYTDESYFPAFGSGSYYELTFAVSVYSKDGSVKHYHLSDLLKANANYNDVFHLYFHKNDIYTGMTELCTSADELNEKCDAFIAAVTDFEEYDHYIENRVLTPQPQCSMVIMEQSTGKVVAIYGGRGKKTASRVINRATNTVRQVGSTFKVLASFLPALDTNTATLADVVDDSQFVYPGSYKEVINWYKTGYRGLTTMRQACHDSMNVCAVEFLQLIDGNTPTTAFNYLKKLGFSTLTAAKNVNGQIYTDIQLPLALGGLTDGVTNLELTAAYATIANGGVYQTPIFYTEVYDHDGNLILSNNSGSTQVIKPSTAWLLTSAMHDVITVGTGTRLAFKDFTDLPMYVAGKTGTSSKANDLWFVGFTPYYTAGIWTGYDNNFSQTNTAYQQTIWRTVMERVHSELRLTTKTPEIPDSIEGPVKICNKCGKLALRNGDCANYIGGNCEKLEYFAKGTVPTTYCDCHVRVSICTDSGHIASISCPSSSRVSYVYLIKDERVYIDVEGLEKAEKEKVEYEPPLDEDGNEIVIYVETKDTKYIIPHGDQALPCPIHNPEFYEKDDEGENFEVPDIVPDEPDDEIKDDTVAI